MKRLSMSLSTSMSRSMFRFGAVVVAAAALAQAAYAPTARACGCFAPPSPATPVLQAGERILFVPGADGKLLMHVQIRYSGDARDFGWIVPLPSVPTVGVGTDELFTQLEKITGPQFLLNRTFASCGSPLGGCGFGANATASAGRAAASDGGTGGGDNPLVVQDSVGPYDFAVLKADDETAMLAWLKTNNYFIPTGTDTAIKPYVHAGAYFLALRLASGKSAGDIQPVVLQFNADYPMIPITLTAVAAQPHMGIAVWVLGASRAVPRNYNHTVIDDAAIDWLNGANNYSDLLTRAVAEAPARHAFVTEYAGTSKVMLDAVAAPGRFGTSASFNILTVPDDYCAALVRNGFAFTGPLVAILQKYIPMPKALINQGVLPSDFYSRFNYWRSAAPDAFMGVTYNYDAAKLTDAIWTSVVTPTLAANALFTRFPSLTYLYTTLSPEDMTTDPTFGFNPDLPPVSNLHTATFDTDCDGNGKLTTDSGLSLKYPSGQPAKPLTSLPASLRTETLPESGLPKVIADNSSMIKLLTTGSCSLEASAPRRAGLPLFILLLMFTLTLAYRSRRRAAI